MLVLLVALSLAQQPEVEVIDSKDLDKAIIYLITNEAQRLKANAEMPVCPIETGRYWNLECA